MSGVVQATPWPELAAELRRIAPSGTGGSPLAHLAGRIAASPYAAGTYAALSPGEAGADGATALHIAQTPWFDPRRGAVSAVVERGRVVLRYHQRPDSATLIGGDGDPYEALERFFVERRWFTRTAR